jgi:hypothetical protein
LLQQSNYIAVQTRDVRDFTPAASLRKVASRAGTG